MGTVVKIVEIRNVSAYRAKSTITKRLATLKDRRAMWMRLPLRGSSVDTLVQRGRQFPGKAYLGPTGELPKNRL